MVRYRLSILSGALLLASAVGNDSITGGLYPIRKIIIMAVLGMALLIYGLRGGERCA